MPAERGDEVVHDLPRLPRDVADGHRRPLASSGQAPAVKTIRPGSVTAAYA